MRCVICCCDINAEGMDTTDVNGRKINIKDSRVKALSQKHLPKSISEKIKAHACGRYTVKAKKKNSR